MQPFCWWTSVQMAYGLTPQMMGCHLCRELEVELHTWNHSGRDLSSSVGSQPNDILRSQSSGGHQAIWLCDDTRTQPAVQLCNYKTNLVAAVLLADADETCCDPQHEAQPDHD